MAKSDAVLESVANGARPILKGRHVGFMKRQLAIAIALSSTLVIITKYTVNEPRKRAYAEYYK